MTLAVGTHIGRYVVRGKIAEGGMAEIYLCHSQGVEGFAKQVAVKRIRAFLSNDPEFVSMFIAEARIACLLNHPNVVQIFDFDKHEDHYYLAMEYVPGRSLWDVRVRTKELMLPIPPVLVCHIGAEVARGLDYAHRLSNDGQPLGLVHRDVTPHNILLSHDGAVKLTDFGIAKASTRVTAPGMIKGKFAYMAPEQARGDEVDPRTDVFALGIILWELLTGAPLFDGTSDVAVLRAVQESEIRRPTALNPGVPADMEEVVLKALQRDPALRYQTAHDLERALAQCVMRNEETLEDTDVGGFLTNLFGAPGALRTQPDMKATGSVPPKSASTPQPTSIFDAGARSGEEAKAVRPGSGSRPETGNRLESGHGPNFRPGDAGKMGTPVLRPGNKERPGNQFRPLNGSGVGNGLGEEDPREQRPGKKFKPLTGPLDQSTESDDEEAPRPKPKVKTARPPPPPPPPQTGLNKGLVIGVAVGVVLALAGVGGGIYFLGPRAPKEGPKVHGNKSPGGGNPNVKPVSNDPSVKPGGVAPNNKPGGGHPIAKPAGNDPNNKPGGSDPIPKPGGNDLNIKPVVSDPIAKPGGNDPTVNPGGTDPGIKTPIDSDPIVRPVENRHGTLVVSVRPWAQVSLDGKTPREVYGSKSYRLSPGRHTLKLQHPSGSKVVEVVIESGKTITYEYSPVELR